MMAIRERSLLLRERTMRGKGAIVLSPSEDDEGRRAIVLSPSEDDEGRRAIVLSSSENDEGWRAIVLSSSENDEGRGGDRLHSERERWRVEWKALGSFL
jgi:hypothetical protein